LKFSGVEEFGETPGPDGYLSEGAAYIGLPLNIDHKWKGGKLLKDTGPVFQVGPYCFYTVTALQFDLQCNKRKDELKIESDEVDNAAISQWKNSSVADPVYTVRYWYRKRNEWGNPL
jgi:hypothetical protein